MEERGRAVDGCCGPVEKVGTASRTIYRWVKGGRSVTRSALTE